jgi:hypothetical protein
LPRTWARVQAGDLAPWRARSDRRLHHLPHPRRGVVRRPAGRPFAHRVGIAQLDRLVEEALVRFDPDQAEARRLAAADNRHVTIYTDQVGYDGTVHVQGDLDLADALDLDQALTDGAARLADLGCSDSLDVRRAHALGELARGTDPTLPLPGREVVLHVHVTDQALSDAPGTRLARVEDTRSFVDADQVRSWCGTPGTSVTVRPVLDLNDHLSSTAYETPDRLSEQAAHVDGSCVFPWCTRPAAHLRLRPRHRARPRRHGRDDVLVQHRPAVPQAPPLEDSYRLARRRSRTWQLPVDQPARASVPPRP